MKFLRQLRALFRMDTLDREMSEEMRAHIELQTEGNIRAGMDPDAARFAAQRKFGSIEKFKETARDQRGLPWLEALGRDLRFSFRSLRRAPAFSATVVLTLALCIGANTAILSVLYGLVLKPLPFRDAGQMVDVSNSRPKMGLVRQRVSIGQYLDYRQHADLFDSFGIWTGWMFNIGEEEGTARYVGMKVSPDYFRVLGVKPLLGRFFTEEETLPGRDNVAVLTQSFWESRFHGDPNVIGQKVRLTGYVYTIVGVVPQSFEELSVAPLLMAPFAYNHENVIRPDWRLAPMASMSARIKPGVAIGAALAQLQTLEQLHRDNLATPALRDFIYQGGHGMELVQLRAQQTELIRNGLLMLQGGAALVLLLGCVNVASLMLARANTRQGEMAIRQALGAGRAVLARQLFSEAALLALTGGALGLGLAALSLRVINFYTGTIIFGVPPVRIDGGLLGLTLLVTLLVALLIGLLPVLRVCVTDSLQGVIQGDARGASRSGGVRATSGVLVVAQIAFALMLLVGAGLLIRSFAKVMAINPGFDAAKVIHARAAYNANYNNLAPNSPELQGLQNRILQKMAEIPGVQSVAYSDRLPGFGEDRPMTIPIRGQSGQDGVSPTAIPLGISPSFLPTMGIRLLEGRNFTAADQLPNARPVLIVDRKFAEKYFPNRSAVGEVVTLGPPNTPPEKMPLIVGVAEVAHLSGLESLNVQPYVYFPVGTTRGGLSVLMRTTRTFEEIMPLFRARLREVDPDLPIYQAKTMQMQLDDAAANRRGIMWLLGAFAGLAVLLAGVGLYGMLAYDVTQRTKEIGIRGAIGATRGQIIALILKQSLWKAGVGLVLGLGGALFLGRYLSSLLYDVKPTDPVILAGMTLLLLLVTLVASWLPARRAARVDPLVALRHE